MKLQTCPNDLSYINALYCAQQLPRFLIFIEKIHLKIKPSQSDFDRIISNVNTPAKNMTTSGNYIEYVSHVEYVSPKTGPAGWIVDPADDRR